MAIALGSPVPETLVSPPGLLRGTIRRLVPLVVVAAILAALVGLSVPCFQDNLMCGSSPGWIMPLPWRSPGPAPDRTPPVPGGLTPTLSQALSTFAVDVDTASLSQLRTAVAHESLPPPAWLRSEEVVNGLDYGWAPPPTGSDVVLHVAGAPSPWTPGRHLLTVALRTRDVGPDGRAPLHLTLLVDRSGSMADPIKQSLIRLSVATLLQGLTQGDSVAVVAYDDAAEVLLQPTSATGADLVTEAVAAARPRGSTNLTAGLQTAYALALQGVGERGMHRVILFTDGVANAGITDPEAGLALVRDSVKKGVDLLAVGVGLGEYGDKTLEVLARRGNGIYVYLDDESQVQYVFGRKLMAHLVTLARDMRVQVAFDPSVVRGWRQVGYQDRSMQPEAFRDDEADAGEVGPGHTVTAVYEVELAAGATPGALGRVAVRWRGADEGVVSELSRTIPGSALSPTWADAPRDLRLAANAALFVEELAQSLDRDVPARLEDLAADAAATAAGPDATASCRSWAELARGTADLAGQR